MECEAPGSPTPRAGRPRLLASAIVRFMGLALLALALPGWQTGASATPARAETPDPFYEPPIVLLRSDPFVRGVPAGARAWRILYTTTRDAGSPAIASAIVLAPAEPTLGPLPIVAWAHGTTGVDPRCAPTLLDDPFLAGGLPALDQIVAQGWALVATDYVGLGTSGPHPYLVGQGEARSVLDAVRAARQLPELSLGSRAIVWGHSQGGHAALWTGMLAPSYAPEIDVAGVAAMAPASDLTALLASQQRTAVGQVILAYLATAYSQVYPDVRFDEIVRAESREVARQMARLCMAGPEALTLIPLTRQLQQLGVGVLTAEAAEGPFGMRLAENSPRDPIAAPLLIAQGETDEVVPAADQRRFVDQRCAAGQRLEYRTYARRDHQGVVAPDSPLNADLVQWTLDRLAGQPGPAGCQRVSR